MAEPPDKILVTAPAALRRRVVQALGNRCVRCGTTQRLQIDHLGNDGKRHREQLGTMSLERWLCQEYDRLGLWPAGFQLLCRVCHQHKTTEERSKGMPPRKGLQQINVALPEPLAEQLSALALTGDFHGSKSAVVEAALQAYCAATLDHTLVANLHTHLATMEAGLGQAYQAIPQALDRLVAALQTLTARVEDLEQARAAQTTAALTEQERRYAQLLEAFDRLSGRQPPAKAAWFARKSG